jgi:pimeloyl-ACP methyl ester carboxylesterase
LVELALCYCKAKSIAVELILGQPCLRFPRKQPSDATARLQDDTVKIIIPGIAQSLDLYRVHAEKESQKQDVLLYQCLRSDFTRSNGETEMEGSFALEYQAARLIRVLEFSFPDEQSFDLIGFSLGGRVALATACLYPRKVSSLHLTGVGCSRDAFGIVVLRAWEHLLETNNMSGFGWSALSASYSSSFLLRNVDQLPSWVEELEAEFPNRASVSALHRLIVDTCDRDGDDYTVAEMALRLDSSIPVTLVVGGQDCLAPPSSVQQLAFILLHRRQNETSSSSVKSTTILHTGHAVPIEQRSTWCRTIL